jgi:death-on-curing protein
VSDEPIRFLTFDEALMLHADQIQRYGGAAGIRDEGLLRSALAQPEARFDGTYLHDTFISMAAAYLYHLVQNHPFVDGNKRIGAACAAAFLAFNGFEIDPEVSEYEADTRQTRFEITVLQVAQGKMSKEQLLLWMKETIHPAR